MSTIPRAVLLGALISGLVLGWIDGFAKTDPGDTPTSPSRFTGEQETVFYVTSVLDSVKFYQSLGFELKNYYDYDEGKTVLEWTKDTPAHWALMAAGNYEFGLTSAEGKLQVGGTRHYFIVDDVKAHYVWVKAHGIEVSEFEERPWMDFFDIIDPDGHTIVIGTRNPDFDQ